MRARNLSILVAGLVLAGASTSWAQQKPQQPPPQQKAATDSVPDGTGESELKLEREVYVYPVTARRDPFESLVDRDDLGPRFEDLTLNGIIYSASGTSVALLKDASGKIYRLRRGERVGNARIVGIEPQRVLFAVTSFDVVHQEQLELKRKENGGVDL